MIHRQKGFTLIELLVVISIIGLLSTVAMTSMNSARKKGRDAKRVTDIDQFKLALEMYYSTYGYYPGYTNISIRCNTTASDAAGELVTAGLLSASLTDPLGTNTNPRYCYEYMGIGVAASYPTASGSYCDGRPRTDYQYSLLFSTESTPANFSLLTDSSGVPNNLYKYCLHGPLLGE